MFVRKRISHKPMRFFEGAQGNKFTMTTLMWFLTTSAVCNLNKTGLRQLSTSFSEASVNSKSCAQAWLLVTLRWENIRSSEVTQRLLVIWYSHSDESVSPFQLTLGQWGRRTVAKFQTQKIMSSCEFGCAVVMKAHQNNWVEKLPLMNAIRQRFSPACERTKVERICHALGR